MVCDASSFLDAGPLPQITTTDANPILTFGEQIDREEAVAIAEYRIAQTEATPKHKRDVEPDWDEPPAPRMRDHAAPHLLPREGFKIKKSVLSKPLPKHLRMDLYRRPASEVPPRPHASSPLKHGAARSYAARADGASSSDTSSGSDTDSYSDSTDRDSRPTSRQMTSDGFWVRQNTGTHLAVCAAQKGEKNWPIGYALLTPLRLEEKAWGLTSQYLADDEGEADDDTERRVGSRERSRGKGITQSCPASAVARRRSRVRSIMTTVKSAAVFQGVHARARRGSRALSDASLEGERVLSDGTPEWYVAPPKNKEELQREEVEAEIIQRLDSAKDMKKINWNMKLYDDESESEDGDDDPLDLTGISNILEKNADKIRRQCENLPPISGRLKNIGTLGIPVKLLAILPSQRPRQEEKQAMD
jgi:hypothetical protein